MNCKWYRVVHAFNGQFLFLSIQQLKACREDFPPQLILYLVVHMVTFQMYGFTSTGFANLYKPCRTPCATPSTICMNHIIMHTVQTRVI